MIIRAKEIQQRLKLEEAGSKTENRLFIMEEFCIFFLSLKFLGFLC